MLLFIQLHFLCQAFSPDTILFTVSSLKARLNYAGLSDLKTQDEISMSFPSFRPIKTGILLSMTDNYKTQKPIQLFHYIGFY